MAPVNARRGAALLEITDLTYRYPGAETPVFEDLSLSVRDGEFVALVGGSGVGKSTLLRHIAGLIAPTAGHIAIQARRERGTRDTAFVFQDTRLMPWRRVRANIGYGLANLRLARRDRQARIDEVMDLTALDGLGERWPHALSGGQAQRVGLARALAVRPRLLLMDEPFSAVDALTRGRLQDKLLDIWRHLGMAILFVTHDIQEAVYLAERAAVLRGAPAAIVFDESIPLDPPRRRNDRAFQAFAERVADAL